MVLNDGTLIDYRRQPSEWMPVQVVEAPCTELRGNTLGGVKTYATEQPVNVVKTGTHCFVLDFATNNTGRIHLPQITIPEGDTVRIRYAETLNADGTLYTANLRSAENTDVFVGNGFPVTMTSEFLWHGFRYIEVTGMKEPDVQRITRQLMTDDLLSAATIEADDGVGMLNKIWRHQQPMGTARRLYPLDGYHSRQHYRHPLSAKWQEASHRFWNLPRQYLRLAYHAAGRCPAYGALGSSCPLLG